MAASTERSATGGAKSGEAFRTIGEVAALLDLPQHVLRFWETRFSQVRPLKRGGNRRYYRPEDVELLRAIMALLYDEGYTIKGVQKRFREQGVKATVAAVLAGDGGRGDAAAPASDPAGDGASADARVAPAAQPSPRQAPATAPKRLDLEEILEELRALRHLLE